MAGNNLRIMARNIARTANISAVPALLAGLTEANLIRPTERGIPARTSGVASQDINLAWPGSSQKANMVGFTRTNLTTAATLRSLLYGPGSPSVNIYDGTALTAYSTSGLDTDIDIYTEADFQAYRNAVQYFPLVTTMEAATLRLLDAANPDGYLAAHHLFLGKYHQLRYDPPFGGAELTLNDASVQGRVQDGTQYVDVRYRARRLRLQLEFIDDTDLPTLMGISRYLGKGGECFVSLYPGLGGVKEMYNMMACRLMDSPTFNPWQVGLHKNTMTFEET